MGDYPKKHHTSAIHQHVRSYYLHLPNSPTTLLRATKPSARRGCAETLGDPYHKQVPLPSITAYRAREATKYSQAYVQTIAEPKPLNQSSR